MAHWVTYKSKTGCYKQQMQYGYVDGVWTHYAIGRALPCNSSSTLTASGKPAAFVPKALAQQTPLQAQESSNGSRGVAIIYVIIGIAAIAYFFMK